jgi:hypothetical protein
MSHRVPKPRNPPPRYASATAKKIARAYRKLKPSDDSYFIICSPSKARVSRKRIINLPALNKPPRQIALSSSLAPHFIFETHSFDVNPPTPTFKKLCDVIETLHAMAKYRPCNKRNANRLNGEMHLIGFRPGNDRGKSAGMYLPFFIHFLHVRIFLLIILLYRNLCPKNRSHTFPISS